jgi:uncharacterized membrane protein YhhN
MTFATLICALACVVLVAAEYKQWRRVRVIAKTIASLAFVVLGALTLVSCEPPVPLWGEYKLYIVVGLVLGMVGDVALLGKSEGAFLVGLTAFLLGHVAYIVGFAHLAPPREWLDLRALIPLGAGATVLRLLWPKLGSMRVPVIAYVIAIVTMVAAALAAARVPGVPHDNRVLLLVGASLFFVSDLAVARDKFVGTSFANRAWGLPAYYAAQLLIAWSLWPGCGGEL